MNSNQLPLSGGITVIIAVIVGYFVYEPTELSGVRPYQAGVIQQVYGDLDVQARLWQDPFAAVMVHKTFTAERHKQKTLLKIVVEARLANEGEAKTERSQLKQTKVAAFPIPPEEKKIDAEKARHSFSQLKKQIADAHKKPEKSKIHVMAVMVSAGPYPELGEMRLRRRYAVVAGLASSGYQPEGAAHIGYVDDIPEVKVVNSIHGDDGLLPAIMPYEWYRKDSGEYLLLLWLDADAFIHKPLRKLNFLAGQLLETKNIGRFSMIGPDSSNSLKAMLAELNETEEAFTHLQKVAFYSAMATAEAGKLIVKDKDKKSSDKKTDPVAQQFISKGILFFRTIADDKKLTDKLVEELKTRLFDLIADKEKRNFQIALVSEWDTLYGRALPDAFVSSAFEGPLSDKEAWAQEHIYRFSYMRGIDGRISKAERKIDKTSIAENIRGAEKKNIERPEGRSQKDYLRRLASDMALTDQSLKNNGTKGIRAIGVLGSDVYDKLLILRALRMRFPKAIFFTTDLDASLLHPDQFQWTRNMLVASSFDLKIANHSDLKAMRQRIQYKIKPLDEVLAELHTVNGEAKLLKDEMAFLKDEMAFLKDEMESLEWAAVAASDEKKKELEGEKKEFEDDQKTLEDKKKEFEDDQKTLEDKKKELANIYRNNIVYSNNITMLLHATETAIPQFRDVYQTSVYLSTLLATTKRLSLNSGDNISDQTTTPSQTMEGGLFLFTKDMANAVDEEQKKSIQDAFYKGFAKNIQPKVYEIGRQGAVDLSELKFSYRADLQRSPFYPIRPGPFSPSSVAMIASCVVLLALLSFLFWYRWKVKPTTGDVLFWKNVILALAIAAIAVSGLIALAEGLLLDWDGFIFWALGQGGGWIDFLIFIDDPMNALSVWIPIAYFLVFGGYAYLIRRIQAGRVMQPSGEGQ